MTAAQRPAHVVARPRYPGGVRAPFESDFGPANDRKPLSISRIYAAHASYRQPGPPSLLYMPLHIALMRITQPPPLDAARDAQRYTSPAT